MIGNRLALLYIPFVVEHTLDIALSHIGVSSRRTIHTNYLRLLVLVEDFVKVRVSASVNFSL
ncbi:uncharacterized protein PHALS_15450 [Plasmopara halstedii]|uniref:Uncharacterized protein n=1 Tax=Plasmopara halstedii TaxID=4781 RepID=A0A0N7L550_PLAHL|nr:uncharacterized protein PHALS_15450 [Plasmopara halstedii]CEG40491.1 hypothetical protein PHALS_15450 [Plasmopara halstedii]|eukprot:XP_024576860.1 hypothetical protein PHALS_15450 [Plasmopara halstedii]